MEYVSLNKCIIHDELERKAIQYIYIIATLGLITLLTETLFKICYENDRNVVISSYALTICSTILDKG